MAAVPPPLNAPRGWTEIQINGHLHTLKILFYVYGGVQVLLSLLLLLGALGGYVSESRSTDPNASPVLLAVIFTGFAVVIGAFAVLSLLAARALGQRQRRTLCLVASGAACLGGALGIGLGVYALVVLLRADVAARFAAPGSAVIA